MHRLSQYNALWPTSRCFALRAGRAPARSRELTSLTVELCQFAEARIIAQRFPPRVDSQQSWRERAWDGQQVTDVLDRCIRLAYLSFDLGALDLDVGSNECVL